MIAEEYMRKHPEIQINVQGGGSTAGILAVQRGVCDIGMSSRELKKEEKELHRIVIARDGIVVIVNPKNKVDDLSSVEIRKIFSGKIKNWREVGGEEKPITVVYSGRRFRNTK
jgi:phosphate transport system substrate-binding protein